MADTARTINALKALLADNTSGAISPQDVRDFLVSCVNVMETSLQELAGPLKGPNIVNSVNDTGPDGEGNVTVNEVPSGGSTDDVLVKTAEGYDWSGIPSHNHDWNNLDNVPGEFNPSPHTHPWSDITDQPTIVTSVNGIGPDENGNVNITIPNVYTVNGTGPDEGGNVDLGALVTSVNGTGPDEGGNVDLGALVTSVNGNGPDESGNVYIEIPGGTVTSVNGNGPNESGNVDLDLGALVYTVNGTGPDESGNVVLGSLVYCVNGNYPDESGCVNISTGSGTVTSVNNIGPDEGGNVNLDAYFSGLPTSDPGSEGALWNDSGTLKISAGGA